MKVASKRIVDCVVVAVVALAMGTASAAYGQAAPAAAQRPVMAEDVFTNIQLLRGIPIKEFMGTMGFLSAATGMNCIDCHSPQGEGLEAYAIDTPMKQTARRMIVMVNALNQANFGGQRKVTCYTCHRATDRPEAIPSLADQYSIPVDDPNRAEVITDATQRPARQPTPDQILDKYIAAVGGAAQVARLTGFAAKGIYEGYDTLHERVPVDIFAGAPNRLSTVVHTQHGESVTTFSGTQGWIAAADKLARVLPLVGGDLQGIKVDASLFFPTRLKQDFKWRSGFPLVDIDERPVQVIQDSVGGDIGVKLYFDSETGLLTRQVRYTETAVGVIPAQVDYSDYRTIPGTGVKIPFKLVVTWTDDRQTYELSEVQPNPRFDAARFAMPAATADKP